MVSAVISAQTPDPWTLQTYLETADQTVIMAESLASQLDEARNQYQMLQAQLESMQNLSFENYWDFSNFLHGKIDYVDSMDERLGGIVDGWQDYAEDVSDLYWDYRELGESMSDMNPEDRERFIDRFKGNVAFSDWLSAYFKTFAAESREEAQATMDQLEDWSAAIEGEGGETNELQQLQTTNQMLIALIQEVQSLSELQAKLGAWLATQAEIANGSMETDIPYTTKDGYVDMEGVSTLMFERGTRTTVDVGSSWF
jgi:conjugal transfer/entry exclusion protein